MTGYDGAVAPVAELVDATDSKSVVRKDVPVRLRPGAPSARAAASFSPDAEFEDLVVLGLFQQLVPALFAEVGEIDDGGGIGRAHAQHGARRRARKPLARLEHRKRAEQSAGVQQFVLGVVTGRVH